MAVGNVICIFPYFISAVSFYRPDSRRFCLIRRNDSHLACRLFSFFLEENKVSGFRYIIARRRDICAVFFLYFYKLITPSCRIRYIREQTGRPDARIMQAEIYKRRIPVRIGIPCKLSVSGIPFMAFVFQNNIIIGTLLIPKLHLCRRHQIVTPNALPLHGCILTVPDRRVFHICSRIGVTNIGMRMFCFLTNQLILIAFFYMAVPFAFL